MDPQRVNLGGFAHEDGGLGLSRCTARTTPSRRWS
jgi:hypothetical protein